MADFLAKLAGRTLGAEPSLRPVIVPMFAAGPMMVGEYISEAVPQETLAGDSLSSLMPESARLESAGLAIRPEQPAEARLATRELISRRTMAGPGPYQSDSHTILSLNEQPPLVNQQPEPGSIVPHIQSDFAPFTEPTISIRPQIDIDPLLGGGGREIW